MESQISQQLPTKILLPQQQQETNNNVMKINILFGRFFQQHFDTLMSLIFICSTV